MNQLQLITPAGAARVVIGIHHLPDMIARQVIRDETGRLIVPRITIPSFRGDTYREEEEQVTQQEYKLLTMFKFTEEMMQHAMRDSSNRNAFTEVRDQMIKEFVCERFKVLASKKPVEFYVANFSIEEAEKLSIKYLENFGSGDCTLLLFKLSEYHKFAAMIDTYEAFKLVMTEVGDKGELVELNPNRWVLGRYGEDMTLLKEMAQNQRHVSGYYPGDRR